MKSIYCSFEIVGTIVTGSNDSSFDIFVQKSKWNLTKIISTLFHFNDLTLLTFLVQHYFGKIDFFSSMTQHVACGILKWCRDYNKWLRVYDWTESQQLRCVRLENMWNVETSFDLVPCPSARGVLSWRGGWCGGPAPSMWGSKLEDGLVLLLLGWADMIKNSFRNYEDNDNPSLQKIHFWVFCN